MKPTYHLIRLNYTIIINTKTKNVNYITKKKCVVEHFFIYLEDFSLYILASLLYLLYLSLASSSNLLNNLSAVLGNSFNKELNLT